MTVRTDKSQVLQSVRTRFRQLVKRKEVMNFDEAAPAIAISCFEIEVAYLACNRSAFREYASDLLGAQFGIPLPVSMYTRKDSSFARLCAFVNVVREVIGYRCEPYDCASCLR